MTPQSPTDEVIIIEEQVRTESERPMPARRTNRRLPVLAAGLVLGGAALGLASTAAARRRANRHQRAGRRRRGALVHIQPIVFAPTLTISLPLSSIVGKNSGILGATPRRALTPARRGPRERARHSADRRGRQRALGWRPAQR